MEEAVELELKDITTLYEQIRRNGNFLENIDKISFVNTPLHAAARTGNTDVVIEITRLKPSFARRLNPEGYSPMHLALQNGQTQTVLQLLDIDPELVRVKGREGITPLHYASKEGDIYLLARFLSVCPNSVEEVTNQCETALHIALKNDKVEAFEFLVSALPRWFSHKEDEYRNKSKRILNWKDRDGNTLLHIATSKNQLQVVRCLLDCKVDVNARNFNGLTPLDFLLDQTQSRKERIVNMLYSAGALEATSLPIIDTYTNLSSPEERLNKAAQEGNVDALYALISEDVYVLERIDQVPFIDTPLHIAASAGEVQFALEMMRLKPSFARKLNQHGFSPLHLALQYEQNQMVMRFLDVDRNLVRVQGREGKTSLHYVTEKGIVDLLCDFLAACPESIKDVTIRKETALHVAAKHNKLEVLEILLGWLQYVGKYEILKWTDDKGNTLLHIAISRSHIQMARLIVNRVQINARNLAGMTALDILEEQQLQGQLPEFEELKRKLRNSGAQKGSSLPIVSIAECLRKKVPWYRKVALFLYRSSKCISNENRSAVLVVSVLIATATFQAALSPSDAVQGSKINRTPINATINEESNQLPHSSSWHEPIVMDVLSNLFFYSNVTAFSISMLVIHRYLPYGTATILVYPLFFCFFLLIAARSRSFLAYSFPLLVLSRCFLIPLDNFLKFRGKSWFWKVLFHTLKHYQSLCNEMMATL